jgi:hypothetical protein
MDESNDLFGRRAAPEEVVAFIHAASPVPIAPNRHRSCHGGRLGAIVFVFRSSLAHAAFDRISQVSANQAANLSRPRNISDGFC